MHLIILQLLLISSSILLNHHASVQISHKIGIILPLEDARFYTVVEDALKSLKIPFHPIIYNQSLNSGYESIQNTCKLIEDGVISIIGPFSSADIKASYPLNYGLNIPVISPSATDPTFESYEYLIRLSSPDNVQSKCLVDLISYLRWDTLAIITDKTNYGINGLSTLQSLAALNKWRILSVQRIDNDDPSAIKRQLNLIKESGARIVVVHCLPTLARSLFESAKIIGLLDDGWVWIGTDGISGLDWFSGSLYRSFFNGIVATRPNVGGIEPWNFSVYANSLYDSINLISTAIQNLQLKNISITEEKLNCYEIPGRKWKHGFDFITALKSSTFDGISSRIEFTGHGSPTRSSYEYVTLRPSGWQPIGVWRESGKIVDFNSSTLALGDVALLDVRDYVGDLLNKTLVVAVVDDPPFIMHRNSTTCMGNSCFSGLAIDLLDILAGRHKFDYVLKLMDSYGTFDPVTGSWDGLMGTLIRPTPDSAHGSVADMGIGAITTTYDRQLYVSFTKPFKDIELGIIIGTDANSSYDAWSFLKPFTNRLWYLTLATALIVGLTITYLEKTSPYGHYGRKAQVMTESELEAMDKNEDGTIDYWEEREWLEEKNALNLSNSILWSLSTLFEQGGERHPRSFASKIVAAVWWFGVLIIIQSYTANLAAFLTVQSNENEIKSIADLSNGGVGRRGHAITYTTVEKHSVREFFDRNDREPYKSMAVKMKATGYCKTAKECIAKVVSQNGTFAFIYDLPSLKYWSGQDCRLKLIETPFENLGYGIALSNYLYAEELTISIYNLRESGDIDSLSDKWISKTSVCGTAKNNDINSERLGLESMIGAFWIFFGACAVSLVVVFVEWLVDIVYEIDAANGLGLRSVVRKKVVYLWRDFKSHWLCFREEVRFEK